LSDSIHVVQVMLGTVKGGAEVFFEKLAIEFQQAGIKQTLVIQENTEREGRLRAAGCDVRALPLRGWRKHFARMKVASVVKDVNANLVIGWMSRGVAAVPTMKGVACLARVGGYYKPKYFKRLDHVVVNAPQLIDHLEKGGCKRSNILLIPNFTNSLQVSTTENAASFNIKPGHRVLASIGRLHEVKGHDLAIKIIKKIPDTHLLIAGQGLQREPLMTLAKELGVSDRVTFIGWHNTMGDVYRVTDVVVYPTRSEPFGNIVLEAWRERVPIVSSDIEGPAWLIDHEIHGLLCKKDDLNGFVTAVQRLLDQPLLRGRLIEAGSEKLEKEFSTEAIVSQYHQFFTSCLRNGS